MYCNVHSIIGKVTLLYRCPSQLEAGNVRRMRIQPPGGHPFPVCTPVPPQRTTPTRNVRTVHSWGIGGTTLRISCLIHSLASGCSTRMIRPWLPNCSVLSCARCALSPNSMCNRSFCSPPLLLACTRQYAACPHAASSAPRTLLERRRRRSRNAHVLHSWTWFCAHAHTYANCFAQRWPSWRAFPTLYHSRT
jgi:hypothetical protein